MTAPSHQPGGGPNVTGRTPAAASALPLVTPTDGPEPHVGAPECFNRDPRSCGAFLTNCTLLFFLQPRTFASEAVKVVYAITHLTRGAHL